MLEGWVDEEREVHDEHDLHAPPDEHDDDDAHDEGHDDEHDEHEDDNDQNSQENVDHEGRYSVELQKKSKCILLKVLSASSSPFHFNFHVHLCEFQRMSWKLIRKTMQTMTTKSTKVSTKVLNKMKKITKMAMR